MLVFWGDYNATRNDHVKSYIYRFTTPIKFINPSPV